MARLGIKSTSSPFDYTKLIAPLEKQVEEYDKIKGAIDELDTSLASLDYIVAAEPENSPLREKYNSYKRQLEAASESLIGGWSNADKQNISKLRTEFARNINPISTAYKTKMGMTETQRKEKTARPSIRFSRNAEDISLGEFINNPYLQYDTYTGDTITADADKMLSPLAKIMTAYYEGADISGYTPFLTQYGLTTNQIDAFLEGRLDKNSGLAKYIQGALDLAVQNSGVTSWNNEQATNEAYNFAKQGVYSTLGNLSATWKATKTGDGGGPTTTTTTTPPSGAYPGDAVNFQSVGKTVINADIDKALEKNENFANSIDSTGTSLKTNTLRARLQNKGIENIDEYETYLGELNLAKEQDRKTKWTNPGLANAETKLRQRYKNKYKDVEAQVSIKDIADFREAEEKDKKFLARYKSPLTGDSGDANTGIYGGSIVESAVIGSTLEKLQNTQDEFVGIPKWPTEVEKEILTHLSKQYAAQAAHTNVSKDGNGIYKLEKDKHGVASSKQVKNAPADLFTNGHIELSTLQGLLINYNNELYQVKGAEITKAIDNVVALRKSLQDFSPESMGEYLTQVKSNSEGRRSWYPEVTYTNLNKNKSSEIFSMLKNNGLLYKDPNNPNNYVAYLQVKESTLPSTIAKVIYDKSGKRLGMTTLANELQSSDDIFGTSLAENYTQDAFQAIGFALNNQVINNSAKADKARPNPQF